MTNNEIALSILIKIIAATIYFGISAGFFAYWIKRAWYGSDYNIGIGLFSLIFWPVTLIGMIVYAFLTMLSGK